MKLCVFCAFRLSVRPSIHPIFVNVVSQECLVGISSSYVDFCLLFQQAAYHPEVNKEVQMRALRYGNECASGYLGLLEHVLVVSHSPISMSLPFCLFFFLFAITKALEKQEEQQIIYLISLHPEDFKLVLKSLKSITFFVRHIFFSRLLIEVTIANHFLNSHI